MKLIQGSWYFKVKKLKKYVGGREIPNVWQESGRIKIEDERQKREAIK